MRKSGQKIFKFISKMMLKPFRKEKSKEGSLEIWFEEKGCGRWNNILVVLLFISHCVGIRCLIQILFSYCFLLIYSVFKLVQSTKTQYLCHQGEKKRPFKQGLEILNIKSLKLRSIKFILVSLHKLLQIYFHGAFLSTVTYTITGI